MAKPNPKNARPAANDRQAKIQAASKSASGGANKIVIAAVVAVLAIVAVVGGVVWKQVSAENAIKGDGNAVPVGAATGAAYPAFQDVTAKPGAPTVDVFEDFQCPACQQFEAAIGSTLTDLAKAGDIKLQYHVVNFLDRKLGNNGSTLAGNGAFCAADAGKFGEFHDLAYENQPREGDGWTMDGLKGLAEDAGITGEALTTWEKCVDVGRYSNYISSVDANAFEKEGVKGTPTFRINGKVIESETFSTPELVKAAVDAAKQ
jgi:protein-disulfide isomerase